MTHRYWFDTAKKHTHHNRFAASHLSLLTLHHNRTTQILLAGILPEILSCFKKDDLKIYWLFAASHLSLLTLHHNRTTLILLAGILPEILSCFKKDDLKIYWKLWLTKDYRGGFKNARTATTKRTPGKMRVLRTRIQMDQS